MNKVVKLFTAEEVLALVKASGAGKAISCGVAFVLGCVAGVCKKEQIVSLSSKALNALKKL